MKTTLQYPERTELLATVAHELRNPLTAILFAVRALEAPNRTSLTVDQAREVIDSQVLRMVRISEDLLSASYASTGKLDLRKQAIDLREVVTAAAETCRPQIDAAHQTLVLRLPSQPIVLSIDTVRITQVMTNLLDNAVKFSDAPGKIVVSIECSDTTVSIRVVDHGIGIAPELIPRVFDLFVQADEARARSSAGMGIGLNLVKRIVELHGGAAEVFSAGLGSGTTFTVHLPRNI